MRDSKDLDWRLWAMKLCYVSVNSKHRNPLPGNPGAFDFCPGLEIWLRQGIWPKYQLIADAN